MKIQNRTVDDSNYLDPVTFIPYHAERDPNHPDAERGVIIRISDSFVFVLFCKSRTVQAVDPTQLVWG